MLGIFHIILHVFECLLIFGCIMVQCKLLQDYDALRGWIEFAFKIDLDKKKNILSIKLFGSSNSSMALYKAKFLIFS